MSYAVGTLLALLGLLAAYFYARSTRFEVVGSNAVADERAGKVAALEAELSIKRKEEADRDAKEAIAIVESGDADAAGEFLSDSFRTRRGPPN